MENVKLIIAENLTALRKKNKLTQLELAEKLNYTDKAVSRWEKGDTLPDIDVLCRICEIYGISFNDLIRKNSPEDYREPQADKTEWGHRITILLLAIVMVWFAATVIFVCANMINGGNPWQVFVYAVPLSVLVVKIFNFKWGKLRFGLIIDSVFIWSLLCGIYISALKYNLWVVFILGVPTQLLIILKYNLDRIKRLKENKEYIEKKQSLMRVKNEKRNRRREEKETDLKIKEEQKNLKKLIKAEKKNIKLAKSKLKKENKLKKLCGDPQSGDSESGTAV